MSLTPVLLQSAPSASSTRLQNADRVRGGKTRLTECPNYWGSINQGHFFYSLVKPHMSVSQFPSSGEIRAVVEGAVRSCSPEVRSFAEKRMVDPHQILLKWEYGNCEEFPAWIVAELGERSVCVAYCLGGFGALGSPWGLVFEGDEYFGPDPGWYPTLGELFGEWMQGAI